MAELLTYPLGWCVSK